MGGSGTLVYVSGEPPVSLWKYSDHVISLGWCDPFPGMLLTVDAVLHKEVPFLLEVGSTVTAYVAFGVATFVPELYKHTSGEKTGPVKGEEDLESQRKVPCTDWSHCLLSSSSHS